jgi:hypothetical protein
MEIAHNIEFKNHLSTFMEDIKTSLPCIWSMRLKYQNLALHNTSYTPTDSHIWYPGESAVV